MQLVQITESFADAGGALENVLVTAELINRGGSVGMSSTGQRKYSARTDAEGELMLDLNPNTDSLANTYYIFNAWHPTTGNKLIDNVGGVVPGYPLTLSDILSRNPNPVSRSIAAAEETKSKNDYLVAFDKLQSQPAGYTKKSYEARLNVVNVQVWPYTKRKLDWASASVSLLNDGELKESLTSQLIQLERFVVAYDLATLAAHSHREQDKAAAQSALDASVYDASFDSMRANIQSLIESVVTHARFLDSPITTELTDLSDLIGGAHPMLSADGLSIRNPGKDVFLFVGDTAIKPGSGFHCVECELSDTVDAGQIGVFGGVGGLLDGDFGDDAIALGVGEFL